MLPLALPKPAIHKSEILAEDTRHCLWSVLTWSMQHMYFGKFPEKAADGKDWQHKSARGQKAGTLLNSAGLCGMIFAITADGEFFQNEYKLPGSSHAECCWSCGANRSSHPHNDYRAGAKWRETIKNHKDSNPTDHLIMTVPGINGYTLAYDSLHILELGVSAHIVANFMFDMVVKAELPGSSFEARLKELFRKLSGLYTELATDSSNQVRRLHLSTFCQPNKKWDSFPELSGVKAKQVRHLIPPLLELSQDLVDESSYKKHRLECIKNLNQMYEAMECQGLHPDESAYEQYKRSTEKCLLHYSKLAKIAISQNILQWNTVHKHHLACHMPEQFRHLNCRFVSTYSGETMVGFMASLGHACLNGTPPHLVPAKVAWRYRLGLHLRVTHGDFDLVDSEEEL